MAIHPSIATITDVRHRSVCPDRRSVAGDRWTETSGSTRIADRDRREAAPCPTEDGSSVPSFRTSPGGRPSATSAELSRRPVIWRGGIGFNQLVMCQSCQPVVVVVKGATAASLSTRFSGCWGFHMKLWVELGKARPSPRF